MNETNGSRRIYWVGGSKGGVGKSMMTVATLDHLLERGAKVLLVECDTSNPDVWKTYREQVEAELIDLDEAAYGWIVEHARTRDERIAMGQQYAAGVARFQEEDLDAGELASIVGEACESRNGWKAILRRCAAPRMMRCSSP